MNMLLAEIQATQWILLGVIALLIICYPIFIVFKNKKEQEKANQLTNSLKVGKEVLTSSGVYGTVVDIQEKENGKIVTLQTGTEKYTSYISVDVLAIYAVLNPDPVEPAKVEDAKQNKEEKQEEKQEDKKEVTEQTKTEENQTQQEEKQENQPKKSKKKNK